MYVELTLKDEPEKIITINELNHNGMIKLHTYFPNLHTIKIRISASECHKDNSKEARAARLQVILDLFSSYNNEELFCPNLKKFTLEGNENYPLYAEEINKILGDMRNNQSLTEVDFSLAFFDLGLDEEFLKARFVNLTAILEKNKIEKLTVPKELGLQDEINRMLIEKKTYAVLNPGIGNNPHAFHSNKVTQYNQPTAFVQRVMIKNML